MQDSPLPSLVVARKTGHEPLHTAGQALHFNLLDFWRWSASDLVSNATRGIFAEFIVATALGADVSSVRNEWDSFDLTTPRGVKVEVKSAAYIQTWYQARYSTISWLTPRTHAWDPHANQESPELRRHADVYVFALLHHQEQATIDPLDTSQWSFFVLPTRVLNERTRSQHSIGLNSLRTLAGPPLSYADLADAVESAGRVHRGSV